MTERIITPPDPEDARECLADVVEEAGYITLATCLRAGQVRPVELGGEIIIRAMVEFAEREIACRDE